jgi:hypothetical protein
VSRWYRAYAGMMRDDKLVRVAIRSGQAIERVCWVWAAILESAAEIDDEGRYDFDAAEAAYFLRADQADVDAIETGLADAGRVAAGAVVKWGDRQFKSDRSAARQADYRERKRQQIRGSDDNKERDNAVVTSLSRHGDAPETETEAEEPPKAPRKRGADGKHLLPLDWQTPSIADLPPQARACAEQWTLENYAMHGEAFTSYWRSERRMKADWRGTWANRVIALHSQVMRDQRFGSSQRSRDPPSYLDHAIEKQRISTG